MSTNTTEIDLKSVLNSEFGAMDYIWIVYAVLAISISLFFIIRCCYLYKKWCASTAFPAMSIKAYTEILTARGYTADNKTFANDRSLAMLVLRSDITEKRIWHNDKLLDFVLFLRNEHSLFSVCFAHEHHPFNRRNRRYILTSMLLLDFALAFLISYLIAYVFEFGDVVQFIVDYLISYIFAILMSVIEGILVKFAVCSCVEKCPTLCRKCFHCFGSLVIVNSVIWSMIAFIISIIFIIIVSGNDNSHIFWSIFAFSWIIGLIQAWFFIDLIFMIIEFRNEWKYAHPLSVEEKEVEEARKKACCYRFVICLGCLLFWWLILLVRCCCPLTTKQDNREEGDDGQDEFGINYHEYLVWKNGGDIGKRELPKSYQILSVGGMKDKMKMKVDKTRETMNANKNKLMDKINAQVQVAKNVGTTIGLSNDGSDNAT